MEKTQITQYQKDIYASEILKIHYTLTQIDEFNIEDIVKTYMDKRIIAFQNIQ